MNNYASITFINDSFYSKTEIDTTLSGYYSKSEIDTTFNLYSPTSQILSNCYSKLYIDNLFITSAQIGTLYYNKTETDNLLANKVSTTGDVTITSNLTINCDLDSSKKFPLDIKNSTIHTEFWTLASFHQEIANSGAWIQFSRDGTSNNWQTGMSSDNSYVIRASDATNVLTVNQNGNTKINGNLDVGQTQTSIKAHVNNGGHTANLEIDARYQYEGYINFNTTYSHGLLILATEQVLYMYCGLNQIYFYKPTVNSSDDRLKENEKLIENDCERKY